MGLPEHFCWTRFGAEAGETVAQILRRKEKERLGNDGIFLWGIGNGIGPSLRELLKIEQSPTVLFSPIRNLPRDQDVSPEIVIRWQAGRALDGKRFELPPASVVTSGARQGVKVHRRYALVCHSERAVQLGSHGNMRLSHLANFRTGAKVGSSQVTAVVRYDPSRPTAGPAYRVALRATLIAPYIVELIDPVVIAPPEKSQIAA
ncbi:MAG: hypothetical protein JOZ13_10160 [Alphaproteobacteria bacterium]|nr:hypothetical protein [Alphaproteobacteria bacterium]